MFVGDYRPTKRVGIEELDGCINLLVSLVDELDENGEANTPYYVGALLAMECIRYGKFEYPHELIAVLDNKIEAFTS